MTPSSPSGLVIQRIGAAVYVQLANQELNFTNLETLREIAIEAQNDSETRALALDLSNCSDSPDQQGAIPDRLRHRNPQGSHGVGPLVEQDLIRALRGVLKPTLAYFDGALNDFAIDIASVCDLRIATQSSSICDSRIQKACTASTGISYLLPRLIGLSQAMRLLLLGESIAADEALRINYIHEIIPDENPAAELVKEKVEALSRMPTRAWEVHKMQVLPQLDQDFETAMVHSLGIRQTHVIKDRAEGIKAWRERRDPEFSGE